MPMPSWPSPGEGYFGMLGRKLLHFCQSWVLPNAWVRLLNCLGMVQVPVWGLGQGCRHVPAFLVMAADKSAISGCSGEDKCA